ncbi:hypothetical protein VAR608DRAFT_0085 [Variovorax sp. HW608]|nr:hypothetical protein VAR608DRAFT_0085 [Variovorax sp. HW608]
MIEFSPSLTHFVWFGHPLSGGNPSGPAKPVPRGSWRKPGERCAFRLRRD